MAMKNGHFSELLADSESKLAKFLGRAWVSADVLQAITDKLLPQIPSRSKLKAQHLASLCGF